MHIHEYMNYVYRPIQQELHPVQYSALRAREVLVHRAHCSSQKVSQASLRRYVWSWKEQLYMCTKVN